MNYSTYALDTGLEKEAEFWRRLYEQFPGNPQLTLILADALLLAGSPISEYGPLFLKGMKGVGNTHSVGGEIGPMLLQSVFRFDYQLLYLKDRLVDADEAIEDYIQELKQEYAGQADKVARIDALANEYK